MYRIFGIILLSILMAGAGTDHAAAFGWGDKSLVTINDTVFYPEDFNSWWKNWQEKDMPFPDDLQEFVDWQLLAQEAEYMELDREPVFRAKIDTFLKVRGLMMLKAEEIDARIDISDEQLRQRFAEKYVPKWIVTTLGYPDQETALAVLDFLRTEKVTIKELLTGENELLKPQKFDNEIPFYPSSLPEEWLPVFQTLQEGSYSEPLFFKGDYLVVYVNRRVEFDEDDFKDARSYLFKIIRKEQQTRYSNELLATLKEKYAVKIDEQILAELDLVAPQEELLDKVLIATSQVDFTVQMFVNLVARNLKIGVDGTLTEEEWGNKKQAYVGDLLFQNLTAWEALDRHYEVNDPDIKESYQFYRRHRLIRELEQRVFKPAEKPTDDEVEKYYRDNIDSYTQPGSARLGLLMGNPEMMTRVWQEVSRGEDFVRVTKEIFAIEPEIKDLAYSRFGSELKKAVDLLAEGEVSPPFTVKEQSAMVKLFKRNKGEPVPLSQVRGEIASTLSRERFAANRARYLQLLRERSTIKINQKAWKKLKSEFGAKNDE